MATLGSNACLALDSSSLLFLICAFSWKARSTKKNVTLLNRPIVPMIYKTGSKIGILKQGNSTLS
jgi:hypothetical protein